MNQFVAIQSEAAVRHLAGTIHMIISEDEQATITLRGGGERVNELLVMSSMNDCHRLAFL